MGDHCSWQILKLVLQMFVPQLHCKVRSLNLKTGTENGTLPFPLPDIMIRNLKTLKHHFLSICVSVFLSSGY